MSAEFKLGDLIADKYRLERPLGEGAYGTVWKAQQQKLRRSVAIKFLKLSVLEEFADRRFEREAKALARLDHPNCVVLFDFGRHDGQTFLVTEFLDGETLHSWSHREHELLEILDVTYQLLDALAHAHKMNIVHRDLKPGNVILTRDLADALCVKVLDFGISSVVGENRGDITKTGEIFGTPGFMSPEQLTGDSIGPASDLYSVGVILFHLLEGKAPFVAKTQIEAALKHLTDVAPALERDVPDGLRTIVARLLEKDPDDRYPTARSVQMALRELPIGRQYPPISAPPQSTPLAPISAPQLTPVPTEPEPSPSPVVAPPIETPPSGSSKARLYYAGGIAMLAVVALAVLLRPTETPDHPASRERIAAALSTAHAAPTVAEVEHQGSVDAGRGVDASVTAALGGSAGCGQPFEGRGLQVTTMLSGLDESTVKVYVPTTYDKDIPHPFVLVFHDTLQTPRALLDQTGFDELADRDGFILVLPEDDSMLNAWRTAGTHARARRELQAVADTMCLDLGRMHLYGHGGGGLAAEEIACSTGKVEALAVSAHRLGEGERPCKHPGVRYLLLAPLHDERDPVEGGVGCLGGAKVSLEAHESAYRRIHGCGDRRETVKYRGGTCFTWDCETPFTSCHIEGGRPLPGGEPNVVCEGEASTFPYGERIWEFFTAPQ